MNKNIRLIYEVGEKRFTNIEDAEKYANSQYEKDKLRSELEHIKWEIQRSLEQWLIPVIFKGASSDSLGDSHINQIRQELYDFMILRRKFLNVVEYKTTLEKALVKNEN